ncbi:MAG: glycosyltransferase family 9 protein [Ferruginibacter sp.]
MQANEHILVIRFSSMGDVAMTVPVISNVLRQNPSIHITVVSNSFFSPLFEGLERCHFYPAYLKEQHGGLAGIFRLYQELSGLKDFQAVVDLHCVLRSHLLSSLFKLKAIKTATLDKGRKEKKKLTRKIKKDCRQLTPMHERYARVFRSAGIAVDLRLNEPVFGKRPLPVNLQAIFSPAKKIIGVAPFAQYQEKMYPLDLTRKVVQHLAAANNTVLLFGGGQKEAAILSGWEASSVFNMAGKYSFAVELAIISNLDIMVSMDSANMHLASLFNVPVISVWGATHRFAGFYGWGQQEENIVETELYCRPCSVFGNKPCYRGDHACMELIAAEAIIDKVIAAKI